MVKSKVNYQAAESKQRKLQLSNIRDDSNIDNEEVHYKSYFQKVDFGISGGFVRISAEWSICQRVFFAIFHSRCQTSQLSWCNRTLSVSNWLSSFLFALVNKSGYHQWHQLLFHAKFVVGLVWFMSSKRVIFAYLVCDFLSDLTCFWLSNLGWVYWI